MRSLRLTLIEDSPVVDSTLDFVLQKLSYPVVSCLDGSMESLEYVQLDQPDLVLVSLTTPVSRTSVELGLKLIEEGFAVVFVVTEAALDLLNRYNLRDPFTIFHWPDSEERFDAHLRMAAEHTRLTKEAHNKDAHARGELNYRAMFATAPISLWDVDIAGLIHAIEALKAEGVSDLRAHFASSPDALNRCRQNIRVLDVNQATLDLFGARSKAELLVNFEKILSSELRDFLCTVIAGIAEGKTVFSGECAVYDLDGNLLTNQINCSTLCEGGYTHLIASVTNITMRKRREDVLKVVAAVTSAMRNENNRKKMFTDIFRQINECLRADSAALVLSLNFQNASAVEFATGEWASATGRQFDNLDNHLAAMMTATGLPFTSADIRIEPIFGLSDLVRQDRCVAGAALVAQQQVIGALWVARSTPFLLYEVELLTTSADIVANAVYRMALHEQTKRYAEQVAAVGVIGRMLSTTLDLDTIYEQLAKAILDLLPDLASIYISNYDAQSQEITFAYGLQDGERLDMSKFAPIPMDSSGVGSQGEVIRSQQPLIVHDLQVRRRQVQTAILSESSANTTQSGIYVPMLAKGSVMGVLYVQSSRANRFSQADAELLTLVGNNAAIAIQNARTFAVTQRRVERLTTLHAIDTALSSSLDMRVTLNILLDQLIALLNVDAADILLLDSASQSLEYVAGRGFRSQGLALTRIKLGEGLAGRAALENRIFPMELLLENNPDDPRAPVMVAENLLAYTAAPLASKGQVKGVLEIYYHQPIQADPEWNEFLETLTGQVAVSLDNSNLVTQLQRTNLELMLAYDRTLEGWSRALDLRDKNTEDHTRRVTELTVRMARAMGLSDAEIVQMRRGALLHDIGKLGIPDRILQKTGPLNADERAIMERHPDYANEMLRNIEFLTPARVIPYCHHEKWDGTGYPRGLKGEEIPLAARIFAVIDVWDSLCSNRPYRDAWPVEKVNNYLKEHVNTHFDPRIVDIFLKMVA